VMRKFGIKYSALNPQHEKVRADLVKVADRQQWTETLDRWYCQDRPGQYPPEGIHK